ncbi:MAG: pyridoxamine kinase [Lachnospiraceae bacterium]|nr:pyridoxamine kinase [Lachnospiraceae bacterium]
MSYNKILTIQDISCVGQCSLTVALPILSACGQETVILPSAVLSTHTGGFKEFTFRDLTDDIPKIQEHWQKEGIKFDAIYTGYLGSLKQINYVEDILDTMGKDSCVKIVDPAMADNGKLYSIFDMEYALRMAELCKKADIVIPNITEACLMTGIPYVEKYDKEYVLRVINALKESGMNTVILTGISYDDSTTGVVVYDKEYQYYSHKKLSKGSHGTGDIFASSFTGAYMSGKSLFDAAGIAAEFVLKCMENTEGDAEHWYGVKFEPCIPELIKNLI